MNGLLRVGARVARTRAEGPGLRFALWLQGCSIRCPGCCNPHLFESAGGAPVPVRVLLEEVSAASRSSGDEAGADPDPIEGVTLLGGEPFEQAEPLAGFVEGVRTLGLSVMAFSGYTLDELRTARAPAADRLLRGIDVLVDGRYDASRPETERLWAGSTNQRFHYFTDRYSPAIERPEPGEALRLVEVRLSPDGRLSANGWPEPGVRRMGHRSE